MSSAVGPVSTRSEAKIALVGVDEATAGVLAGCFRQFGIDALSIGLDEPRPKFDDCGACVVPLNNSAEPILKGIRAVSHRTVVYGLVGSVGEALKYSPYGINALFYTPVRLQDALQVVRATHLLVLKELRRYVRVPLICSLTLKTGTEELEASSVEVSAGGMSFLTKGRLVVPQTVLAKFSLPGGGSMETRAVVCWTRHDEGMAAVRFDPSDGRRTAVRRWIDEYLGS